MDTRTLLWQAATSEADERQQAFKQLELAADSHYPVLLENLVETGDTRVTFWALDLLIRHSAKRLQRDANQVIPLLLACLNRQNWPIADRAAWALNIVGLPAVEALLAAIAAAPNSEEAGVYTGALRSNTSVYIAASQVLEVLDKQLNSTNEQARFWAMVVLMDISPLRPWFDARISTELFEPLYPKLLATAQAFRAIGSAEFDFAARYEELLVQHLATRAFYVPPPIPPVHRQRQ